MENNFEYWKKRCELAEKYIDSAERAIEITDKEMDISRKDWCDFKNSAKAGIEPEENIFSFGINEIKALDTYVSATRSAMNKVGELTPWRSQDFDILFMHINNLKMLAGVTEENNFKLRFNYDPTQKPTIKGFHHPGEAGQIREIIKDNFSHINLDKKSEAANGKFITPKMSFADFAKTYMGLEISEHHQKILNELQSVSSQKFMSIPRRENMILGAFSMFETLKALSEGKNTVVATKHPKRYAKQMKQYCGVDIELKRESEDTYHVKLIKKEE